MLCVEDLSKIDLFQCLPQARLHWVCDRAQKVELAAGEILVQEGAPARGVFLLIVGQTGIRRLSEGLDIPLGQHKAPAFFGEVPILTDEPILVTLHALTDCLIYEIAGDDFRTLLHECRSLRARYFESWRGDCAESSRLFGVEKKWQPWERYLLG